MIVIQASSAVAATKQAFLSLYTNGADNTNDKSIWREDAAVIEIDTPIAGVSRGFTIENEQFQYGDDYGLYFPGIDLSLVGVEEKDYTELFLRSGRLKTLVSHFRLYPDSRRQLVSSWSLKYMNPKVTGVCITQLYCRLRNNSLELHSHARANDAYRLLLLDMQLAISVQREIARQLGMPVGRYIHYVDSLHFYRRYRANIESQLAYIQNSSVWKEM